MTAGADDGTAIFRNPAIRVNKTGQVVIRIHRGRLQTEALAGESSAAISLVQCYLAWRAPSVQDEGLRQRAAQPQGS